MYRAVDPDGQVIDVYVSQRQGQSQTADRPDHESGHRRYAFVQNLHRSHYEVGADAEPAVRLAIGFDELGQAI